MHIAPLRKTFLFALTLVGVLISPPIDAQLSSNIQSMIRRIDSGEFGGGFQGGGRRGGRGGGDRRWTDGGSSYTITERGDLVRYDTATGDREVIMSAKELTPPKGERALAPIESGSTNSTRMLFATNPRPVMVRKTANEYWVLDKADRSWHKLGGKTNASLLYARLSPDGARAAYVRGNNIWVENIATGAIKRLTHDGSENIINGTSDWVNEEELYIRDAFEWSPDGRRIAFLQFDQRDVPEFTLINYTDTLYPALTKYHYPKAGQTNSAVRLGVVSSAGGAVRWVNVPGDPRNIYIPRFAWVSPGEVVFEQLNRLQNTNNIWLANAKSGQARLMFEDHDAAWVEVDNVINNKFTWLNHGERLLYVSERDGWRHAYAISRAGDWQLITTGAFDLVSISSVDEAGGWLYYIASPDNATQRYLYRSRLDSSGTPERVTSADKPGTHIYNISPDGHWAFHTWSKFDQPGASDLVSLPDHKVARTFQDNAAQTTNALPKLAGRTDLFQVDVGDGVKLDGWMIRPTDFDASKKYPLIINVYGEPAATTVNDSWGGSTRLLLATLADDGYIVASFDNRGTPAPKGRAWRKVVYGSIGVISSKDQAAAVRALAALHPYVDLDRVGVFGWSGGGSMTLNLLFRSPDLYKVGVAGAPVPDEALYDSIYQERYMGLPNANAEGFKEGSPITFASGLQGKLLIIHGTGDDNVHFQGTQRLINKLIELNKQFSFMEYPNRRHGISGAHLDTLRYGFLEEHLPAGPATTRVSGEFAGESTSATSSASRPKVPDLRELMGSFKTNEMRAVTQRYQADRGNLTRFYNVAIAPERCARLRCFEEDWLAAVQQLNSASFSEEARAEATRLLEAIRHDLKQVNDETRSQADIAPLIPFSNVILDLDDRRRRVEKVDVQQVAAVVDDLAKQVARVGKSLDEHRAAGEPSGTATSPDGTQLHRAGESVKTLRTVLKGWFGFYDDYDPMFTWWLSQPYKEADKALTDYADLLEKRSESGKTDAAAGSDSHASATETPPVTPIKLAGKTAEVPDLTELISAPQSRMRAVIERYQGNGGRGGGRAGGGRPQPKEYYTEWLDALQKLDFGTLTRDDQIDYLLLKNRIEYQLHRVDFRTNADEDTGGFVPFQSMVQKLTDSQDQREKFDAATATEFLRGLKKELAAARDAATNQFEKSDPVVAARAGRAARALGGMRSQLQDWRERNGGDWPTNETFEALYKGADDGIDEYASYLREKSGVTARRDGSDIVGRPIGPDELKVELEAEMISYTPEELVAIAEKEFAWCIAEMKKASREMGLGDDWRAALEKVKDQHVPAGEQPYLIRDLAWEAVDYLETNDLVTIPEIARETWRMQMMSLQRQMVNPFFTGGDTISVSYPMSEMSHDQKLQSMRGNNIPFSRATVFHELIPGHELQGFTAARYHTERRPFSTAFYVEGWAVYWELLLYERSFHGSPENRMGALFWRLHRCARIIFSLNFHLKRWSPQQCIDYLVAEVGHERDNATAEVRRSFGTSYGPLYQAGYLLGALQLRELHREVSKSGKMSDRAFHDAVLKAGSMPIAMVRASLTDQPLNPDYRPDWRFYESTSNAP